MSIQAQVTPSLHSERRRSERFPFRESLFVCGRSQGKSFKEETVTLSVSAHGALIALSTPLLAGQKVLLMNPQTWDEREGYVRRLGKVHNERTEVAIEFASPAPEFWPIVAPGTSLALDREFEAQTLRVSAAIPLANLTYSWQQAVLDALMEVRPEFLQSRINAARRVVSARLRDPNPAGLDERKALEDALRSLHLLSPRGISVEPSWKNAGPAPASAPVLPE